MTEKQVERVLRNIIKSFRNSDEAFWVCNGTSMTCPSSFFHQRRRRIEGVGWGAFKPSGTWRKLFGFHQASIGATVTCPKSLFHHSEESGLKACIEGRLRPSGNQIEHLKVKQVSNVGIGPA